MFFFEPNTTKIILLTTLRIEQRHTLIDSETLKAICCQFFDAVVFLATIADIKVQVGQHLGAVSPMTGVAQLYNPPYNPAPAMYCCQPMVVQ